eukprot:5364693-Amphidinium_carterae.1
MWRTKHVEEVDEDVATTCELRCVSTPMDQQSETLGSGGARLSLPTLQEAKAGDAFLETTGDADSDEFERPGLHGRAIFTSILRAALGGTQSRARVFGAPRLASIGSDLAEDRENA